MKLRNVLLISILFTAMIDISAARSPQSLQAFATRYAAAWSSQDPASLASFYAPDGTLVVNDGEPAVGRAAIEQKAAGFMQAFPDMVVRLDSVEPIGETVRFRWIWTGTNSGPGGTGRSVELRGHEDWSFDAGGLIRESRGHYDEAEYNRQVNGEVPR